MVQRTLVATAALYEVDETAWLEAAAELIRQGRLDEVELGPLAEYLSDMAKRDRREVSSRLVVPTSQQHSPMRWSSHKDHALKALAKLAGPHMPVTLKQVEKAVAKVHLEHEKATSDHTTISRADRRVPAVGTRQQQRAARGRPAI